MKETRRGCKRFMDGPVDARSTQSIVGDAGEAPRCVDLRRDRGVFSREIELRILPAVHELFREVSFRSCRWNSQRRS
jgi:hypothetical protein